MGQRLRVEIQGAVQGVGFRPFVYRLATSLPLAGYVLNDSRGVVIEVEGSEADLQHFARRLVDERPATAHVQAMDVQWLPWVGLTGFEIRSSDSSGEKVVLIQPDLAPCGACLDEVMTTADRRHRYPFTNCTHCGPRYSIIEALPYDRPHTTMRRFTMCEPCRAEYGAPADRRFHAQPNGCPRCGPSLAYWSPDGRCLSRQQHALAAAAAALQRGEVVALKGVGGFQLLCDARSRAAVARLRQRKGRPHKPLALMARDVQQVRDCCCVSDAEAAWLSSQAGPIVLLRRRDQPSVGHVAAAGGQTVADNVAPQSRSLGVMLPSTPLHHLLMAEVQGPLVATSGNLVDESICIDEAEAVVRLGPIVDGMLVHDRPIARHVDDSVGMVVQGELRLLRRARGFAPLPVGSLLPGCAVLGVGAQDKSTVALGVGGHVVLSQHIGDLSSPRSQETFQTVIRDLLRLYGSRPRAIAHDLHPDYASSRWAVDAARGTCVNLEAELQQALAGVRRVAVQHHHAHLAACLADSGAEGPTLGVIWDGAGYGGDGTIWGGELLLGDARSFRRVGHLAPYPLPGGDAAAREPWRSALGLLWQMHGREALEMEVLCRLGALPRLADADRGLLAHMLGARINTPMTSSAGRLFDAVAALLGQHGRCTFEGQAAMALEQLADPAERQAYPLPVVEQCAGDNRGATLLLDWRPLVHAALADIEARVLPARVAARFHNGLVQATVQAARAVDVPAVALSGGCFQNRLLLQRCTEALGAAGFTVHTHRQIPPNDGGVAAGQVVVAAAALAADPS